ncbi:hypothetical protein [Quadrisphaera granulorum]|uniref:hypothetical protein n=1 Tax=Quadrisphaera granulorum TaxID=317664 RepID=UPI0011B6CB29|nr:hypothetical protein [Quadrisphaera granulorum]
MVETGIFCLVISFAMAFLSPMGAPPAMAWLQSTAWWIGLICIAGHVLRLAFLTASSRPTLSAASDDLAPRRD